jgi:sugar phosphate isomerase/epimerase
MENPICISTGFLYRLMNDRNEMINKIREFSPDGIELSFAYPRYLFDFVVKEENLKYLQSLKFVSIHSPWKEIIYDDSQRSKDILVAIEKLYKQINARNVVFSNKEQVVNFNRITGYNFTASIENDDWKHPLSNNPEVIEKILFENRNLKFTFDFAHALTVSSADILIYLNKFKDRLINVHLAMLNRNLRDHWFLHKFDNKEMKDLLNHLKSTNIPIILECVASDWNEVPLIKKEIEYIKGI